MKSLQYSNDDLLVSCFWGYDFSIFDKSSCETNILVDAANEIPTMKPPNIQFDPMFDSMFDLEEVHCSVRLVAVSQDLRRAAEAEVGGEVASGGLVQLPLGF